MGNERFYLEEKFIEYCGFYSSKKYADYIYNIIALFNQNGKSEIFSNLKDCFESDKKRTLSFLENASLCIKILYDKQKQNFNTKLSKKTLQDYNSALIQYISFLNKNEVILSSEEWTEKCKEEEKAVYEIAHHINGTDSLLQNLNTRDPFEFVKKVLAASYFFDPKDVEDQFNKLKTKYDNNLKNINTEEFKMDARWSETYLNDYGGKKKDIIKKSNNTNDIKYKIGNKEITVKIDKDGNKAVRDLIKTKTGHKVSQGIDSTFHFYKISHIWGNAFDPRYFTNLWNIVLVPAWANDLLDKTNSRDPLTVAFQQIVKNVCFKHYKMESLKWNLIDMNCPEFSKDYIDSLKNNQENNNELKIQINVFCQKDQEEFAKIRCKTITI